MKNLIRLVIINLCFLITGFYANAVELESSYYADVHSEDFFNQSEYRKQKTVGILSTLQELELNRTNKVQLEVSHRQQDTRQESSWTHLKTLSLQSRLKNHRISIGQQQFSWEATDLINPFDFIHQKNLRNPLPAESLSAPSIEYTYLKGAHSIDLIYIVEQPKTILPDSESPWLPRSLDLPIESDDIVLRTQDGFSFQFLEDQILNQALKNQIGFRYKYVGDSFDISLVGFEGAKNQPLIFPTVSGTLINDPQKYIILLDKEIQVTPVYYRNRVGGVATSVTLGSFIIRYAGSYHQPLGDDQRLPGWNYLNVGSIERTFSFGSSLFTLQIFGSGGRSQDGNSLASVSSLLESAMGAGFRYAYKEHFTLLAGAFSDAYSEAKIETIQMDYKMNDYLKTYAQAFFIDGTRNLVAVAYKENDFAQFGLKVSY